MAINLVLTSTTTTYYCTTIVAYTRLVVVNKIRFRYICMQMQ